jgi:hypothetical protein
MKDPRKNTLAIVSSESRAEFERLVKERKKGDLLYEPWEESLYVWELEIDREHVFMGGRNRHKWTDLYVTRDLAIKGACVEILKYWGDGCWSEDYRKRLEKQMAAGEYEKAMEEFTSHYHYQALGFTIRPVEVKATSKLHEISEPPTSKET